MTATRIAIYRIGYEGYIRRKVRRRQGVTFARVFGARWSALHETPDGLAYFYEKPWKALPKGLKTTENSCVPYY